jgi:hypothetical protein
LRSFGSGRYSPQRERIGDYLHKDRVRPLFADAVGGLQGSLRTLQARSASIWNWPWSRGDKQAAVEEATGLLQEIVSALETLQGPIGSGLCCNGLYELSEHLNVFPPARPFIDGTVDEIRAELMSHNYINMRRRIVMNSELLLGAFPRAKIEPTITPVLGTGCKDYSEQRGS